MDIEDARAVASEVMARYEDGRIDRVELAYTQFRSVASQAVLVRRDLQPREKEAVR